MTDKTSAGAIVALVKGDPGPFFEDEAGFYGKKRVTSEMKDAPMETDCGGAMITKAKMTYGEADTLASQVDLTGYPAFVATLVASAYWERKYKKPQPEGRHYVGSVWWSIYSYLATEGHIDGNPKSYKNQMEYLYNEVLKRLVNQGVWAPEGTSWRWFQLR